MIKQVLFVTIAGALVIVSITSAAFAETKKATAEKKAPSAAQVALRDRQKKCGIEWRDAKAAGKIENGMKWPQYWSSCNKRLKGA
jgi:hypothetical protein